MNLNAIANGIIQRIHADETFTLYRAVGQIEDFGDITPLYDILQDVKGNIQPLDADTIRHLEAVEDTKATMQVFANFPLWSVKRLPAPTGGDILKRGDGTYWLVTSVIEDWEASGWCNAGITQQLEPPKIIQTDGGEDDGGNGANAND